MALQHKPWHRRPIPLNVCSWVFGPAPLFLLEPQQKSFQNILHCHGPDIVLSVMVNTNLFPLFFSCPHSRGAPVLTTLHLPETLGQFSLCLSDCFFQVLWLMSLLLSLGQCYSWGIPSSALFSLTFTCTIWVFQALSPFPALSLRNISVPHFLFPYFLLFSSRSTSSSNIFAICTLELILFPWLYTWDPHSLNY